MEPGAFFLKGSARKTLTGTDPAGVAIRFVGEIPSGV
jgi:hypothetical protein